MTQQQDSRSYVTTVLTMYTMLPETPIRVRPADRKLAECWYREGVTIQTVESALLLGQIRRLGRPAAYQKLAPVRSLYYFVPLIGEVIKNPLPDGYLEYIKSKLRKLDRSDQRYIPAGRVHFGA